MSEALLLELEEVLDIHAEALARYGGQDGVRDQGLFESAVHAAVNVAHYGQGDLFEIAAAYAFHIAENQAFFDGNKRTAIGSALTFLRVNGIRLDDHDGHLYDALMAIAAKTMTRDDLAVCLRGWAL